MCVGSTAEGSPRVADLERLISLRHLRYLQLLTFLIFRLEESGAINGSLFAFGHINFETKGAFLFNVFFKLYVFSFNCSL